MRLVIVRHGEAEAYSGIDARRELTPRGRKDIAYVGEQLAGLDLGVQRIYASPYVRAQQTAALLATGLIGASAVMTEPLLQPDTRPNDVVQWLGSNSVDSLVLVSHQPLVSRLLDVLVGADVQAVLMPACCAVLEADALVPGCVDLVRFLTPEH